ncbi:MAG: HPF/RaiA family ribosome-associated protein [Kofleriaceae bacterium]|nr:HPF/RaiA family ribosome-associated protein [Kofleriaceae bacterium]
MATKFPIAIRSNVPLTPATESRFRRTLERRVGRAGAPISRGTIRFEDINGPRGGVDKECRIKLVLTGRPSVQASERDSELEPAFDRASHKLNSALTRAQGKLQRRPMKLKTARKPPARKAVKTKAQRAKRRVGVQRAARR